MAGGSRGGDGQQQQQGSRGGDLQQGQGGRVDFAPASVRDLEVNTSARAQADKSTLKVCMLDCHDQVLTETPQVYLPNGGFNVVKFGDATDIKVRIITTITITFKFWQKFRLKINHELVKVSGLQQWARRDRESGKRWKMNGSLMGPPILAHLISTLPVARCYK